MRELKTSNIRSVFQKKKHLISKVFLPTFIISLSLFGIIKVASASATTWAGNGTNNGFCATTTSDSTVTGQNWLFILTSPGTGPWTLTAHFSPATNPDPITVTGVQQGNGSIHFTVNTAVGAQLLSASATNGTEGSVLTVSDCVVGRGTSTVTTTLHDASHNIVAVGGSVSLGTVMHDLATVTPSGTTAPTGNVSFTFFSNGSCSGDGTSAGVVALNGANPGIAHPSNSTSALSAGSYGFKASWPGDTNYSGNTSSCENFTVSPAQLNVTTDIHNASHAIVTSVPLGSIVHDTANLTGSVSGFATPAVTFTFFSNIGCTGGGTSVANTGADEGNTSLVRSAASSALAAGSYAYKASVAGNTNYLGDDSDCEPLTVNRAQLTVTTNVHNAAHNDITNGSVPLGSVTHDTATVTGGVNGFALPATSFTLTTGYTGTCANGSAVANNGTENGAVKSADSTALGAGVYAYRASVASDSNYIGGDSSCEPFTVNKAQLSISTLVHNAAHQDITNGNIALGSITHDTATVSGAVSGFTVPTDVSFTLTSSYTDSCDNGAAVANNGTEGSAAKSADSAALGAGSYAYRASIAGNDNYIGADSSCEPFSVNKAQLLVTTDIHDANHQVVTTVPSGSVVHDTANVAGVVNGFTPPTVTFTFYNNNSCTGEGTPVANTGPDEGNTSLVRSAASSALSAGFYSYKASVAGDTNYLGDSSDCEPLTVSAGATRTLGFWQTHFTFTNSIAGNFNSPLWVICANSSPARIIDSQGELYGGFYASIPKTSSGSKRSSLDQARMQLMQQLLAAILNNLAFGGGGGSTLITNAKTAYCTGTQSQILNYVSLLDTFNSSGDSVSTTQNTGSADPKATKASADLAAWDLLP